jgi:hypothetical protein
MPNTLRELEQEAREVAETYINGNISDAMLAICSHRTNNRGESALLAIKVLANLDREDRKRFVQALERRLY